jgi:Na+/H+ antiporter NhaD/arsenite permease-like protein
MKWEKPIGAITTSVIFIFVTLRFVEVKANMFSWIVLVCSILFLILFIYWFYRRVYGKNISSVLKSLEELKALKD